MMTKILSRGFIWALIVVFWIIIFSIFLFLPHFVSYLRTQKTLTIFTWPLLLDPVKLSEFERSRGIKLAITYFENGPALVSKVAATQGKGYDLLIPDDHSLELLIKDGLIKKIDRSRLSFWNNLNPRILNTYADPANEYSIPYYWGVYGIGYNSDIVTHLPESWSVLFDPTFCFTGRICMTDDPREAVLLTAQYLFGSIDALRDHDMVEKVKQALIKQKKLVEVYTIARADTLLQSRSCGIAAIMSPELWRLSREHAHIDMILPQEGSFIVIDSFVISKQSENDALIYDFLNYLYQEPVLAHHIESFGYCSPLTTLVLPGHDKFCPEERLSSFDFFRGVISDDEINKIWIEVLAA